MKGHLKRGWLAAAVLFATATVGVAQTNMAATGPVSYPNAATYPGTQAVPGPMDNRSNNMASPGTVNYVEGQAMLDGQPLPQRSYTPVIVAPNQVIDTSDGYVEILLTPGAFLRIGHNSELRVVKAGLAGVSLQLNRGAAMIEAADLVKGSDIEVSMNGAKARIEEKGLYAFDADQRSVKVLKGKAVVMEAAGETTLKNGDAVFLASNKPLKRRDFDVKAAETEPLYVWSKVRSEDEAQENVSLARNVAVYGGWYGPGWYWDPFWADYAFLPGAGLLYSPFGWGFYSPGFVYVRGFYGHGFYGASYGHAGAAAGVRAFAGGGFHGGAGRR